MGVWQVFRDELFGYARYLGHEITHPHWGNYFYWLIGVSVFAYAVELIAPWRREQAKVRKDFWLDAFYMFFNFFLFNLIGFAAVAKLSSTAVQTGLGALFDLDSIALLPVDSWPVWAQLLTLFVLRDFVQWNVHRLLHRVPMLWRFHEVHHSVEQMGFAAHLRYHPVETIVYRSLEFIPLSLIGFGIDDFLVVHLFALVVGHLNHANTWLPLGPLKYVLNNPQMHIWHHVHDLPEGRRYGINFGITLSLWDYLFGTAVIPSDGRDIELGFPGMEEMPSGFVGQLAQPLRTRRSAR